MLQHDGVVCGVGAETNRTFCTAVSAGSAGSAGSVWYNTREVSGDISRITPRTVPADYADPANLILGYVP